MIVRKLEDIILSALKTGKAIILLGPRQTGKTTLLEKIAVSQGDYLLLDCDDPVVRENLTAPNTEQIRQLIGGYRLVFIDEAQRVKNIGLTLKLITDRFKDVRLLVSGSSSLDLMSEINEPLTGRKREYFLFPISWHELRDHFGYLKVSQQLEQRIIYGMYPEVINNPGKEKEVLRELTGGFLYKDLLAYQGIRKPDLIERLLRALALQVGSEVSYNELAGLLQVDKKTISTYIDLLEKAFIVFRLQSFRKNLRNEIAAGRKIYFYDTGIRNSLIAAFAPMEMRQDAGLLWENFLIAERMKHNHYSGRWVNPYFWRTVQQQEIDYIEEAGGKLFSFEVKWKSRAGFRISKTFLSAYPDSENSVITRDNFTEFVM